ncbi:energy transducer TonB [Pelagicoccus sp. SDUM812002]|uniref:energy transducer TonB n=1 Tax=Pelagicoccus sp. SDUM812002 TaxID=3041266 RepID=UPI00280F7DCF|nr:energy transducer TonB [Pelagicoccus sp. SDUM812002]MDQ8187165.1 energy transducer TonB [Pelagicoccus sp. SDUM812002]
MDPFDQILADNTGRWKAYLFGALASVAIFISIILTRQFEIPVAKTIETQISEFYPPPPPPPPKATPPEIQEASEIDFTVPIDPTPFEFSLDYLKVQIGPESKSLESISFDLDQSIEQFRSSGLDRMQVYETKDVDEAPVPIRRFTPKLPAEFKSLSLKAIVQYRVTEAGTAENITILDTNIPEMNEFLISTIKRWGFKPAIKDGSPVQSWARHRISIENKARPDSPFAP